MHERRHPAELTLLANAFKREPQDLSNEETWALIYTMQRIKFILLRALAFESGDEKVAQLKADVNLCREVICKAFDSLAAK